MTAPALPPAAPESVGLNPARLKRLSGAMAREIEEGKAPGLAMLIARNGKIGFHQTMGVLRPGGPPMREDAIFRIYSMTKPIVSVATMTLVEEGRLLLSEPVAKYLPAFASMTVGVERDGKFERVPAARPITILDLMRHTSGFTYGFLGTSPVHRLTHEAYFLSQNRSMDEHLADLAALPLLRQPGEVWEYGHSTDVLGRIVEIVSGMSLGRLLQDARFSAARHGRHGLLYAPGQARPARRGVSLRLKPNATTSTRSIRPSRRYANSAAPASSRRWTTTRDFAPCSSAAARSGASACSLRADSPP